MIHLLGWLAVGLMAAHSYNARAHLDPRGVLEHRAGLPAMAYASMMLLTLALLVTLTGAGGTDLEVRLDAPAVFDPAARTAPPSVAQTLPHPAGTRFTGYSRTLI